MGIIVDHDHVTGFAKALKATLDTPMLGQASLDRGPVGSEGPGHGCGGQRISHSVQASASNLGHALLHPVFDQPEASARTMHLHVNGAQLAPGRHAIAVAGRCQGQQPRGLRIVATNDQTPTLAQAADKRRKRRAHTLEVAIDVEVIGLEIGDDRDVRREVMKRPIELVGLNHRQIARTVPQVAVPGCDVTTYKPCGIHARSTQHLDRQRRRARLAVRARDRHDPARIDQGRQGRRTLDHRNAALTCARQFGVRRRYRRCDYNGRCCVGVLGSVPDLDARTELLQPSSGLALHTVAPTDLPALPQQPLGERIHAGTPDAHEVHGAGPG